jgi:molybdopterin molybdotransferase
VTALRWDEARDAVRRALSTGSPPAVETVALESACERILANAIHSDRGYPPFPRSMRDGFAVRTSDIPGRVRVVGEVRAGQSANQQISDGECVEIMTGAPVPVGADAVLMVEHADREGNLIDTTRVLNPGENICPEASEVRAGECVLQSGTRIDYGHIGVLATVGVTEVQVYAKPSVAIIATGDELVELTETPEAFQIRNSNSYSLAAQVRRAGGIVAVQTVAKDNVSALRAAIDRAFKTDLVLFSGGVSAGKYDLVETVLAEYDAEFVFTRVLIQPGQPAVFGKARGKHFFGLPGNPASTMVTFELFARLALELLAGNRCPSLPLCSSQLTTNFNHKQGLTRFLPATLSDHGETVTPVKWQGSGDVFALGRANAFLVAESDRESWNAGDSIRVLPR